MCVLDVHVGQTDVPTERPGDVPRRCLPTSTTSANDGELVETTATEQITFIFIDFRVCDFAFKTQNAPCVSSFKRILFSDRFQFAF